MIALEVFMIQNTGFVPSKSQNVFFDTSQTRPTQINHSFNDNEYDSFIFLR